MRLSRASTRPSGGSFHVRLMTVPLRTGSAGPIRGRILRLRDVLVAGRSSAGRGARPMGQLRLRGGAVEVRRAGRCQALPSPLSTRSTRTAATPSTSRGMWAVGSTCWKHLDGHRSAEDTAAHARIRGDGRLRPGGPIFGVGQLGKAAGRGADAGGGRTLTRVSRRPLRVQCWSVELRARGGSRQHCSGLRSRGSHRAVVDTGPRGSGDGHRGRAAGRPWHGADVRRSVGAPLRAVVFVASLLVVLCVAACLLAARWLGVTWHRRRSARKNSTA